MSDIGRLGLRHAGAKARSQAPPASLARGARCRRARRGSGRRGRFSHLASVVPAKPIVSMPWRAACSNAEIRLRESPLVEMPSAMSSGAKCAISWRANTRSNPTSFASAVSTVASSARHRAAKGCRAAAAPYNAARAAASGGASTIPECEEAGTGCGPCSHGVGRSVEHGGHTLDGRGLQGHARCDLRRRRRGKVDQQRARVTLVPLDERIEEVGFLAHDWSPPTNA